MYAGLFELQEERLETQAYQPSNTYIGLRFPKWKLMLISNDNIYIFIFPPPQKSHMVRSLLTARASSPEGHLSLANKLAEYNQWGASNS